MTKTPFSGLDQLATSRLMRRLEPRIMLDAAAPATLADIAAPESPPQPSEAPQALETSTDAGAAQLAADLVSATPTAMMPAVHAIAFIDASVSDLAGIAAVIGADVEIVQLDADRDAVSQMVEALAGRSNLSAIHIISHGSEGILEIGNASYDSTKLESRAADLASIGAALSENGDILVYGCRIGAGQAGADFTQRFADLTGADVAASTDDTGAASLSGDWDLESQTGFIEASPVAAPEWDNILTVNITTGQNAATLVNALTDGGRGITVQSGSESLTGGSGTYAGLFSTSGSNVGIDDGVILGTGNVNAVNDGGASLFWSTPGTGVTEAVGFGEFDVARLSFTFTAETNKIVLAAVFGSEEYPEYVGSSFNDSYAVLLSGPNPVGGSYSNTNITVIPGTSSTVTINNINHISNSTLFTLNSSTNSVPDVVLDGLTHRIDSVLTVTPGATYTVTFRIADVGDAAYDSAVFIDYFGGSLVIDLDDNDSTAGGASYLGSFTENGTAVAVVDSDVAITNYDPNTNITSASIKLVNAKPGDAMAVGTLPAGLSSSIQTNPDGSITVTLAGSATEATYQLALKAITFSTSGDAPDATQRQFEVSVNDGVASSNVAKGYINVIAVNDAPIAAPDAATGAEDTAIVVAVLANDTDVDNPLDPASVVITSALPGATLAADGRTLTVPGQGVWTVNPATGNITFTPIADYNGTPTPISYRVSDIGGLQASPATVSVTVTPVDDNPIVDLNSTASAADMSRGNAVTYTEGQAAVLVAAGMADVSDSGEGDLVSLAIAVSGQADGAAERITIAGRTFDASASSLQIVSVGGVQLTIDWDATAGTFTVNRLGGGIVPQATLDTLVRGITYHNTSEDLTAGARTLTITATDIAGLVSTPAVATVAVAAVNDPPVASADTGTGAEDTPIVVAVLANDTDVDSALDPASVVITSMPPGALLSGDGRTLTVPGEGVWTVNPATGTITFTPAADYNGAPTPISYRVSDVEGAASGSATVSVTVTPVNDPPIVDLNSSASSGDTLRNASVVYVENSAAVAVASNAGISDLGENDITSLQIAVAGFQDGASEVVTIAGVAFDPTVNRAETVFAGASTLQVTYVKGAAGSGTFVITQVGGGAIASADLAALVQGITYAHSSDNPTDGNRTLTFTARDQSSVSSSPAVVTIDVAPVNDDPATHHDAMAGSEHQVQTGAAPGVLGNDSDVDGGALTVVSATHGGTPITIGNPVTLAGGGVLTLDADGSYVFAPGVAYNGLDDGETVTEVVTYTVSDGNGGTATATLTLTVNGANDAPVVIDPANPGLPSNPTPADPTSIIPLQTGDDGQVFTSTSPLLDVASFAVDPDGDVLTFSTTSALPAGLVLNSDGTITGTIGYDASQGGALGDGVYPVTVSIFDGAASITVQLTIDVSNPGPVAAADVLGLGEDAASVGGDVLSNDHDTGPDGDPLTVISAVQAGTPVTIGSPFATVGGGMLTLNADGSHSFTPGTAYNGLDDGETATEVVSYTVSDGNGGTATATLAITVSGSNDAPVIVDPTNPGTPSNPVPANPASIIPLQEVADGQVFGPASPLVDVASYAVDPDGDALTFTTASTLPAGLVLNSDGTITGTIDHLASQGGPNGDGVYPLTVSIFDGTATSTVQLTIDVSNLDPVAVADTAGLGEDAGTIGGTVLGNDHDTAPDSDLLAVIAAAQSQNAITLGTPFTLTGGGVLTLNPDGGYAFVAGTAYNGLDDGETATEVIAYTVSDGNGGTATATLTITVSGSNDAPVVIDPANPGTSSNPTPADPASVIPLQTVDDGQIFTGASPLIDVAHFAADPDSEPLTFTTASALPLGLVLNPDGTITGTIDHEASQGGPNDDGMYPVIVTISDGTTTATVHLAINVSNPGPVAAADTVSLNEDAGTIDGGVLGNDHDTPPDSDLLRVVAATQGPDALSIGSPFTLAGGGVLTLNADGSYVFAAGTAYNGLDDGETATEIVTYVVSDGNGGTAAATLTITVGGSNDAPVVIDPANPGTPWSPIQVPDPANIIPDVATTDGTPLMPIDLASYVADPEGDVLAYTLAAGTPTWISIDPDTGAITGTPPSEASQLSNVGTPGVYAVTAVITDDLGLTATTTITFAISNPAPIAAADTSAMLEDDAQVTGNALANDGDGALDADTLAVAAVNGTPSLIGVPVAGSSGGMFAVKADGTWTFAPGADFQNLAEGDTRDTSLTYRVADGQGGTAEATITVTVTGSNDAPVALGPIAPQHAVEGEAIMPVAAGTAFANPLNAPLVFSAANLPAGLVIETATGLITGTPAADAAIMGPYVVLITATGPDGESATIPVVFSVANPAPVATADAASTPAGDPIVIAPLANDSDPDGDTLAITDVSPPAHGTVALNPDGTLTYTPDPGFTGTEELTYTITDSQGAVSAATVTIAVGQPATGAPSVVTGASPVTAVDGTEIAPIACAELFSDPDGQSLTFAATGLPEGLAIDPTTGVIIGTLSPDAALEGPYQVTVIAIDPDGQQVSLPLTIAVINPAPVAADDQVVTAADTPVTLAPLANDYDADGDTLVISAIAQPAHGSVAINPDGTITYSPAPGFTGVDTFSYAVSDGEGGTTLANITVNVGTPLDGAPVIDRAIGPFDPVDGSEIAPIDAGSLVVDPTDQPLTFAATGLPDGLTIDPVTGIITGTLPPDASADGPYQVVVTAVDPDGNQASVVIVIAPVNLAPVAEDDHIVVATGTPATLMPVANDTDPDGDTPLISAVDAPAHGTVSLNPDGSLTYTPEAGYVGVDAFAYTIIDGDGGQSTAMVKVTVGTVPEALAAKPGFAPQGAADGETIIPIPVAGAFSDPDAADGLTYSVDASALPAGLTFDPTTGAISGTLDREASQDSSPGQPQGTYVVSVTATDTTGASVTTTVTITIANPIPVVHADSAVLTEDDAQVSGNVITDAATGDVDAAPDSDPLIVISAAQGTTPIVIGEPFTVAGGGVLTLNADGSYSFDPGVAYNGLGTGEHAIEVISYTVSDGNGGTATTTLAITVDGRNDAPVIIDPASPGTPENPIEAADPANIIPDITTVDGAPLTPIDVGAFVVDPEGEALAYSLAAGAPDWIAIGPDTGVITGTPPPDASQQSNTGTPGAYLVTVVITDDQGVAVETTITFTLTNLEPVAVNDAPVAAGEDALQAGNALDNDHDAAPDSDPLAVIAVSGGTVGDPIALDYGTFVIAADGGYIFTPNALAGALAAGEVRTEVVVYTISDGNGGTASARITLTITGSNDAPIVVDPSDSSRPGDPTTVIAAQAGIDGSPIVPIDAGAVFRDPDATDVLAFSATGLPPGLAIDPATGRITGTLDTSASAGAPYQVSVTATDPHGGMASATFVWSPSNPAPEAADDVTAGNEDGIITGTVTGNDRDPDGDAVTFALVTAPAHGTLTLNADGTFIYTPDPDFNGVDSFVYRMADADGVSDSAHVTLNIAPVNDAPILTVPDSLVAAQNTGFAGDRLAIGGLGIDDIDSTTAAVSVHLAVEHGTLSIDPVPGLEIESGNAGRELRLTGSPATIDAALAMLGYLGDFGFNGGDRLVMSVNDLANGGLGGSIKLSRIVPIEVKEVATSNISKAEVLSAPEALAGNPMSNLSDINPAIPKTDNGIDITYPNNTFIHYVVTDTAYKIDVQYGVGQGSVQIGTAVKQASDPSLDNAGLVDPLTSPTLGTGLQLEETSTPIPAALDETPGESQGQFTAPPGEVETFRVERHAGAESGERTLGEDPALLLDLPPVRTAVPLDRALAARLGRFDHAARQLAEDVACAA